jgi:hypothetical protein
MSFYPLPSVRMPKSTAAAAECNINASLSDYLAQLPKHASQYEKLGDLCEYKEKAAYFKLIELFSVLALPKEPFKLLCLGTQRTPVGPFAEVVDAAPRTVDLLISDADFAQTLAAACKVQAVGGMLVVEVGRLSTPAHVRLAYVMAALYKSVSVYTPSLYCGEEKYLIGRDFKGGEMPASEFAMSLYFLTRLEEINSVIGQAQMDHIRSETKYDQSSADWCTTYLKN